LFSISKSYHAAALRSGAVVADKRIISGIRNHIFQTIDSVSIDTCAAFAGAYNDRPERQKIYDKYFTNVLNEYSYRYYLMKSIIDGIDSIENKKMRNNIFRDIKKYSLENPKDYENIENIDMISNVLPDSGFFAMLDYTKMKDKYYYTRQIINDEELSRFFYCDNNIKFLTGSAIGWPNKNQLVGRVTYAFNRFDLVNSFLKLKESASRIKDHPTKYNGR
jgi:aspartate/methionine/tyrosine aminotransferase